MKFNLLIFLILFPPFVFPQQADSKPEPKVSPPARVTRIVRIRYGIPQKIADLLVPGTPATITADNYSKVIVLKGNPNDIASVEQTIRELDVPSAVPTPYKSKDIELIVSVIGGSDKADLLSGSQIPETMTPVVKQLRAVFPYKNYQLLSSMLLRSSEGAKAESRGSLAGFENHLHPSQYIVEYGEAGVSTEEGKPSIHLRNFKFEAEIAVSIASLSNTTQFQNIPVNIGTGIDLREGQKVVAGKANIGNSDLALFVVLTARLVD